MCKRRRRNACGAVVAAVLTRSCYPTYGCYSSGRAGPHPDPPCTPRASGSAADSSSWFVFRHQTEQQSSNMQHAPCQATVQTGRPGVLTCMHDTPAPRPSLEFGSRAGRHARTRPGNARTGPAQPSPAQGQARRVLLCWPTNRRGRIVPSIRLFHLSPSRQYPTTIARARHTAGAGRDR